MNQSEAVSVRIKSEGQECQAVVDRSTSMDNQLVRNTDHLTNQQANHLTDQLDSVLSHSTRTKLFATLSDLFPIIQCGQAIPDDAKQRTREKIDESIRLLLELSPFKATQSADSAVLEERISGQILVRLSSEKQLNMIGHLMASQKIVLFGDQIITDEIKLSLAAENKRILHQLLDLPCREQSDLVGARSVQDREKEHSDEPLTKKQKGRHLN